MDCLFTCSIQSILKIAHLLFQQKSEQAPLQIVNPTLLSSMESSDYCLLELRTSFLSHLQARCGMARALLLNHFASTWTMAKVSQAPLKLVFQEQLCPNKQATQTGAADFPAVSFDDSTVDNKSRLAVAVTILSTMALGEGCNRQKGLLFQLQCWQPLKEL